MVKQSASRISSVELMNAELDGIKSDLKDEFQEDISDISIVEGSPVIGEPWTTVIIVTFVASAAGAAGKKMGELLAEDVHDFLLGKYEEWSHDYSDEEESPSPGELPYRYIVQINIIDEDGDRIVGNTVEPRGLDEKETNRSN